MGPLITITILDKLLAGWYDSDIARRILQNYEDSSPSEQESRNGDASGSEGPSLPAGRALSGQSSPANPLRPMLLSRSLSGRTLSSHPSRSLSGRTLSGQPSLPKVWMCLH